MRHETLQDYRERMLRALVFIQQNLGRHLTLEEIADVARFSPFHFHRIFRGMMGETLGAHLRRIRLERAAHHLRHGDLPITRLALEAGFASHEAFTRAFKAMTGQAPSGFRAARKAGVTSTAPSGTHFIADGQPPAFEPVDTGGSTMDVTIRRLAPKRVAFMRHIGPYDRCGETWERLMPAIGSRGLIGPGTLIFGLCHDDPEVVPPERLRYDACITVPEGFLAEGEIGVQTVAGGDYAVTTHEGPYATLGETYARLYGQWIPRSGRRPRPAPCLEVYLNDPEGTEPEDLLTDIHAPLEPT